MAADTSSGRHITGEVVSVRDLLKQQLKSRLRAPVYQRPFVWDREHVDQLFGDAASVSRSGDQHFLGAIVRSRVRSGDDGIPEFLIVDGQQRLTTITLFILASMERLGEDGADLLELVAFRVGKELELRWTPTNLDSRQMETVLHSFGEATGKTINIFSSELRGGLTGRLHKAFLEIRILLEGKRRQTIRNLVDGLLDRFVVVSIDVPEGVDSTQVFQSINATGKQLKSSDLVRNLIFQKFSDDSKAETFYSDHWQDFEEPLKEADLFEDFLYTFATVDRPGVTKSSLFRILAHRWQRKTPKKIVEDLEEYRDIFLAIAGERELPWTGKSKDLDEAVTRICQVEGAKNAWPYLLELLYEERDTTKTSRDRAAKCIRLIETILVRRALIETQNTGIRYFFAGLYKSKREGEQVGSKSELLRSKIKGERDLQGPSDERILEHLLNNDVYGSKVRKVVLYVLQTWERSLYDSEAPSYRMLHDHTVDHVMPQKWTRGLGVPKGAHREAVNRIGNLVILQSEKNSSKGCKAWCAPAGEGAVQLYKDEFEYRGPQRIARDHPRAFGPRQIEVRTTSLVRDFITKPRYGWPQL